MLRYEAHTDAPPETTWVLLACPTRWEEWAPHVRGAWGLGWPQVREGAIGAVRLFGVVPVPARVIRVNPGESSSFFKQARAAAPGGPGSSGGSASSASV